MHSLLVAGEAGARYPAIRVLRGRRPAVVGRWSAPATDPDPEREVASELAAVQQDGSLVLGRPCYHGRAARSRLRACALDLGSLFGNGGRQHGRSARSRTGGTTAATGRAGGLQWRRRAGSADRRSRARRPRGRDVGRQSRPRRLDRRSIATRRSPGSLDPLATRRLPRGCEIHIAAARDSRRATVAGPRSGRAQTRGAPLDRGAASTTRAAGVRAGHRSPQRIASQLEAAQCLVASD